MVPSLQKLKYQGDRSTKELVKFAMSHVHVSVAELWHGNFAEETQAPNRNGKPWLLSVHKDDGSGKGTATERHLSEWAVTSSRIQI